MLLLVIVALGLVSAIAFSASYQLVARFANKSVIALGLGCVGSGLIVLVLEMAVHLRHNPSQGQLIWLFELTAGLLALPENRFGFQSKNLGDSGSPPFGDHEDGHILTSLWRFYDIGQMYIRVTSA